MEKETTLSFYDWCVNNNRTDLLDRWDYDLNSKTPKQVQSRTHKKYYFKCPVCKDHPSTLHGINSIVVCHNHQAPCSTCESFGMWCQENQEFHWLELWDYELNIVSPFQIHRNTGKKYCFKCKKGKHKSEQYYINAITGDRKQKYHCKRCNSFGQWCVDNNELELLQRWDCARNKISPFEVSFRSGKNYWFTCPKKLHESEPKNLSNLIVQPGTRECKKCSSIGQLLLDSYGENAITQYWYDINTKDPFLINRNSEQIIWIKCTNKEYHKDYKITAINFTKGQRCPYCAGKKVSRQDSLGYLYPESISMWSGRNKLSPYDYLPKSNKKVWFTCPIHGEYFQSICDYTIGECECPQCKQESDESSFQKKVRQYLEELGYNINHEYACSLIPVNPKTGRKLPMDNEVIELNLYIEVNGQQHYQTSLWHETEASRKNCSSTDILHEIQWRDKIKKEYIISHNSFYLTIPYWDIQNGNYKEMINNKIEEIKQL